MIKVQSTIILKWKARARAALSDAVKNGQATRLDYCENCGTKEKEIHAHHPNYDMPLLVIYLCDVCHGCFHHGGVIQMRPTPAVLNKIKKSSKTTDGIKSLLENNSERFVSGVVGVSIGTLNRFKKGVEPQNQKLRNKLGLPVLVPACAIHGPTCPHKCKPPPKQRRKCARFAYIVVQHWATTEQNIYCVRSSLKKAQKVIDENRFDNPRQHLHIVVEEIY